MIDDIDQQLERLAIAPSRGLIICDVDEVVVHFLRGLEAHLEQSGFWLDAVSFALNGNVRRLDDNAPATTEEVRALLQDFFGQSIHALEAIDGAVEILSSASAAADTIFLTNLPAEYLPARRTNLAGHGLDAPVLVNDGPKGPAVRKLAQQTTGPCIFIDDAPGNVQSAVEHAPDVHVVHFVHDPRFAAILEPVVGVSLRTGSWRETGDFLNRLLLP